MPYRGFWYTRGFWYATLEWRSSSRGILGPFLSIAQQWIIPRIWNFKYNCNLLGILMQMSYFLSQTVSRDRAGQKHDPRELLHPSLRKNSSSRKGTSKLPRNFIICGYFGIKLPNMSWKNEDTGSPRNTFSRVAYQNPRYFGLFSLHFIEIERMAIKMD